MQDWLQNKEDYRNFCRTHGELPVFFQDWWLDVVCQAGSWEVCLAKDKGGNIQGVLPFYKIRKFGLMMIKMPDLTPYLGLWLKYPAKQEKQEAVHRFQKKVTRALIEQLPEVAYYTQDHPPTLENCLPFIWKGFQQTTRFSYCLDTSIGIDALFDNLKGSVRTEIRKAEKEIKIFESEDLKAFYELQTKSFVRQGLKVPYTFAFLQSIDKVLHQNQRRQLLIAKDEQGNSHAAIYLLWDDQKVYNLLQGADPGFGDSGAIKLLLWEGIKLAHRRQATFDFEGGMMPNIEAVFSSFGGKLQPYFKIYKGGSRLFRFLSILRNAYLS